MRISIQFKDDVAIMTLSGKFLAGGDGPFLRQKVKDLADAGTKRLILDFTDVPYIDSTGLGFLVGSRVTAQTTGISMVLAGVNPHVKRILDSVKLSQFFTMVDDEAAALARVRETEPPKPIQPKPKSKKRAVDSETTLPGTIPDP